jgi:anti-anti-sigma regulatory factor
VVFSFFKKDRKSGRDSDVATTTRSGAATTSPGFQNTTSAPRTTVMRPAPAVPDKQLARSLARETAAKIDAIESEMTRDFLRGGSPGSGNAGAGNTAAGDAGSASSAPASAPAPAAPPAPPPAASKAVQPSADLDDIGDDPSADLFAGLEAVELSAAGSGSVIDEAAILFANGQLDAAEAALRAGIDSDTVGQNRRTAWRLLLELINQRGDPAAFEEAATGYALRFGKSPPAWIDYRAADPSAPAVVDAEACVKLPAVLDAQIVQSLEQLKRIAAQHAALRLDLSATESIDLVGAELLLRVLTAFKRSSHQLTLIGAERLLAALRRTVEPGRRDASDAAWMLLIETLRLLGRQDEFEESAIQYCVTFEVSPPSWEPAPSTIVVKDEAPAPAAPPPAVDPLDWRGEIEKDGEPFFGRLTVAASGSRHVVVQCRYLRRMAFSSGTTLLALVMKLQGGGIKVEFRDVNALVAALFYLVGITAAATVQVRSA